MSGATPTPDPWELICCRYLDTDEPEEVAAADRELRALGYRGPLLWLIHAVAFGGCVWNLLIWWDWFHLGLADVLLGWTYNAVLLAAAALLCALFLWSAPALLVAAGAAGAAVVLGFAAMRRYEVQRERRDEQGD